MAHSIPSRVLVDLFTECIDVEDRLGLATLRRGKLEQDMLRLRTQLSLAIINMKAATQQRETDRVNMAADKIQAVCRGRLARKHYAILRYFRDNLDNAATKIQSSFRGYSTRSKMAGGVEDRLVRERAAMRRAKVAILRIEATCRGFLGRRQVARMNLCAMLLQALSRGFVSRCMFNRRRRHQCMLQSSGLLGLSFVQEQDNLRRTNDGRKHGPHDLQSLGHKTFRPQPPPGVAPRVRSEQSRQAHLRPPDTKRSPYKQGIRPSRATVSQDPNVNFVVVDSEKVLKSQAKKQPMQNNNMLPLPPLPLNLDSSSMTASQSMMENVPDENGQFVPRLVLAAPIE